jgi:tripartite-type tricarboxylate transporter receptor subunit TctC
VVPSARRSIAVFLMLAASAPTLQAAGEEWPARPVRLIIPFPPGGSNDIIGRMMGLHLGERLGKSVVVDNRSGAGGNLGIDLVAKAEPDGYTMLIVSAAFAFGPSMYQKLPFDPVKSFAPVAKIGNGPNVVSVFPGLPVKSAKDLIALAKAKPGALNYGSAGVGSSSHLAGALLVSKANIDVVHVPFRVGGDSRSALLAGAIQFYVFPLPAIVGGIRAGQFRALAVASPKRAEALPDLATSAEAGFPQYISESWFGIVAPRALPRQFITRLNADAVKALQEPQTRERVVRSGAEPRPSTPEEFAKLQRDEYAELGKLIKETGMKVQ